MLFHFVTTIVSILSLGEAVTTRLTKPVTRPSKTHYYNMTLSSDTVFANNAYKYTILINGKLLGNVFTSRNYLFIILQ